MSNECVRKIVQARISLLFQHPFFGQVALGLKLKEASDWCDTMAVDGKFLYFNTAFVEKLTPAELMFVVGHEVLHVVFEHFIRINDRNPTLFNIAGDYVINEILVKNKVGTMLSQALYDSKYFGMTTEHIYDLLFSKFKKALNNYKKSSKANGSGGSSAGGNNDADSKSGASSGDRDIVDQLAELTALAERCLDEVLGDNSSESSKDNVDGKSGRPHFTKDELKEIQDNVKANVVNAVKSAGKTPLGLERLIKDITEPQIDWRQELNNVIQSTIISDYTFYRPSRKSGEVVLPGLKKDEMIKIAAAFDMSGSIGEKEARSFLSELNGILSQYSDYEIDVWSYDTAVYNHTKITPQDSLDSFVPKGGGGTDFMCNYAFMEEEDITPEIFINFTDGYPYGKWGIEEFCNNQIFCIVSSSANKAPEPPFGRAIYINSI
jgi:predicted metal-dependent peptidase